MTDADRFSRKIGWALRPFKVPVDALWRFNASDGWAIASHIALTILMSLFPFLIVVTAVAGLLGSTDLANQASKTLLSAWPREVAEPISSELLRVATSSHTGVLTLGALFAAYFAASGVDGLRVGLNRAYEERETRGWFRLKFEAILWVVLGAFALVLVAVLVVLGPILTAFAARHLPWFPTAPVVTAARYGLAVLVSTLALLALHAKLPAGRRRLSEILPGVVLTVLLWLVAGAAFGWYLEAFPSNYVRIYAGLASVMVALIYLDFTAAIFIYGGEFNAAARRAKSSTGVAPEIAPQPAERGERPVPSR